MKTLYSFQGCGNRLQLYVKNDIYYITINRIVFAKSYSLDVAKKCFIRHVQNIVLQCSLFPD